MFLVLGGGSPRSMFGAGSLGMGFCPGDRRGVDLNEVMYEPFWAGVFR